MRSMYHSQQQRDLVNIPGYKKVLCSLTVLTSCASVEPQYEPWPTDKRAQVHIDLAQIYLERGQIDVAKEEFSKARKIDPSSDQAIHGLGLVEAQSLKYEKAKTLLSKAVSLNGANLEAVADYAILLCETNEGDKGINLLSKAQKRNRAPDGLGFTLAFGRCYQSVNEYELAESSFATALQMKPDLSQALYSMAELKANQGQALSARGFIQRYFSTRAMSSKALLLGAKIEQQLGNMIERNRYTKNLKARYPNSQAWKEAQIMFKL